jgi:Icc-related predicted phosphoesterase
MHYSPTSTTLDGEPREVWPFLGSSRLGQAIDRNGGTFVVHGHAHAGVFQGTTRGGVKVFNCAASVLRRLDPPRAYAVFDLAG